MRVLVFGDSLVYGRDAPSGGWVQRLASDHIERVAAGTLSPHAAVYNLGVGGDRAKDVLKRFEAETQARIAGNDGLVIVFAVGINDAKIVNDKPVCTPRQYIRDLGKLLKLAQKYTDMILFVGLTPVEVENEYVKSHWTSARVQEFDDAVRAFALDKQVAFVPLLSVLQETMAEEYIHTDGLHLNDDGHAIIYEAVQQALALVEARPPDA